MKRALLLLLLAPIPALANDAALLRCRAIPDASARLACYDALPVTSSAPAARPTPTPAPAARPELRSEPRAEPGAAPPRPMPAEFGLEQKRERELPQLQAIESHIPGAFEGWHPKSVLTLANGQVWQISDDSTRRIYRTNPKVTIRRGALGSFFLDVEGDNSSPRVRRLQ